MSLALHVGHRPVTAVGRALHPTSDAHPRHDSGTYLPYVGIAGVLLGSLLSTLGTRISTLGLADIRGGVHAGFDEGAWITTSIGLGQMLVGVCCPYLGAIVGTRRLLLWGIAVAFVANLLIPLSPNLTALLVAQFLSGVGLGTFIPVTIGFITRSLPARLVVFGLAVYAMNSEFSQNIAASLEGWYTDNWSWSFVFWQHCVLLVPMFACVWIGIPRERINVALLHKLDWPGLTFAALGFTLLYAALDQGNRLDWRASGVVTGLATGGALLTAAFVVHELVAPSPFLNLRLLGRRGLLLLMVLLAGFRFIILSTAYIIPAYLQTVQNFRELQVGAVLLWIALPQVLIVLPLGALLTRCDARLVLGFGAALIGVACLMATDLTSAWATADFLPSQILQALGQSCALTALVVAIVRTINPADALTIGALLQISRLFGGEIGTAFMQTFVRTREQLHSNLLGLHVDPLANLTRDRLAAYTNVMSLHTSDAAAAAAQANRLLLGAVTQQANVLSYIDGFLAAGVGAFVCLLLAGTIGKTTPQPAVRA